MIPEVQAPPIVVQNQAIPTEASSGSPLVFDYENPQVLINTQGAPLAERQTITIYTSIKLAIQDKETADALILVDKAFGPEPGTVKKAAYLVMAPVKVVFNLGASLVYPMGNSNPIQKAKDTLLLAACSNGNLEVVQALVKRGANIHYTAVSTVEEKQASTTITVLLAAIEGGNINVVAYLLDQGLSPNGFNNAQVSPLHLSICNVNAEMVDLLLKRGAKSGEVEIELANNIDAPTENLQNQKEMIKVLLNPDKPKDPVISSDPNLFREALTSSLSGSFQ